MNDVYDPKKLSDFFDTYGEKEWERLEGNLHGRVEYEVTMHILGRHLPEEGHILDAGCGPGRYSISLAKKGYTVSLVDISEEQLRMAGERIDEAGVRGNISEVRCLDICDLSDIPDATYDAVLCLGGALSYVRDERYRAISELIRVAKPGSPLIVGVMSLFGAFHLISHFDVAEFLLNIEDHCEWDPTTEFPDHLDSKLGSNQWHAPMTLYSSEYMRKFMEGQGCEVLEMSATQSITSSYLAGLEKISGDPKATEMLMRLEKEFCTRPGVVDMGQHLLVVARTPGT